MPALIWAQPHPPVQLLTLLSFTAFYGTVEEWLRLLPSATACLAGSSLKTQTRSLKRPQARGRRRKLCCRRIRGLGLGRAFRERRAALRLRRAQDTRVHPVHHLSG